MKPHDEYEAQYRLAGNLAIGRLWQMMQYGPRPTDAADFEKCRRVLLDCADALGMACEPSNIGTHRPGWTSGGLSID